jgi:hypothetical protein
MPNGLGEGGGVVGCEMSEHISCAERAKQGTGAKEGLESDEEEGREAEGEGSIYSHRESGEARAHARSLFWRPLNPEDQTLQLRL